LLLSAPGFGQYTWIPRYGFADNTAWCATNNCLTSIGGVMAETKAGIDGTVYGLQASGVLYTYTAAKGWVEAPSALQTAGGLPLMHISVGSSSQVLALNTAAWPGNNVYVINSGGTAWQSLSGTLSFAEVGADGSIWGVQVPTSAIYQWNGSS
jgi:hypothetical protein